MGTQLEASTLCQRCSGLDFQDLFTGDRKPRKSGSDIRKPLGNLAQILASPDCPFCRLVSFIVTRRNLNSVLHELRLEQGDVQCFIEPWRADAVEGTPLVSEQAQSMAATSLALELQVKDGETPNELANFRLLDIKMHASDPLCSTRPLMNGFEASLPVVNLNRAQEWISTCRTSHIDTCENFEGLSKDLDLSYKRTFRLINVQSRTIKFIDPQTVEYAALSYVWGYSPEVHTSVKKELPAEWRSSPNTARNLPNILPKTIEDAITVCDRLGLLYLWVDILCINQEAPEEVKVQIMNMGNTYRRAVVTIVAAWGMDSQAGLPGVREYPQDQLPLQRRERVQDVDLITGLAPMVDQFYDSRWATRAWTYQEGLLSRRCLIFGGAEPVFICGKGLCRESLAISAIEFENIHGSSADVTMSPLEDSPTSMSIFGRAKTPIWSFGMYTQVLRGYCQRNLSFKSDTLAASEGYLRLVSDATGTKFVWGLPLDSLLDGLSWCGYSAEDERLEEFPSWSWAGWSLGYRYWPFFEDAHISDNGQSVTSSSLPSRLVSLSGMDYLRRRVENPVLQHSAIVKVCPGHDNRRLMLETYVAQFEITPSDLNMGELQCEGPNEAPVLSPHVGILGKDGDAIPQPREGVTLLRDGMRLFDGDFSHELSLFIPLYLSVDTYYWLMDGMKDFVMLRRWEEQRPEETGAGYAGFNYVLALLVDNRKGDVARRLGIMAIPTEEWDANVNEAQLQTVILE